MAKDLNEYKEINSHIQMPKCILKQFVNEHQSFYYYDINEVDSKKKIKLGHPKSLNTKLGYYSICIEKKLQNVIESPLGRKIKYINDNDFAEPTDVPLDLRRVALTYAHSLLARSPHMFMTIEKYSMMLKLISNLTDTEQNDLAVQLVMQESEQNSPFENYIVTMAINKTNIPFLLPMCGMYSYGDFICMPISQYRSIALVNNNSVLCKKIVNDDLCKVLIIEDDKVLNRMNLFAIQSENSYNKQYVVSSEKELLRTYLDQLSLV
jgi:hypothetical protein